jgi:hypothetical protein
MFKIFHKIFFEAKKKNLSENCKKMFYKHYKIKCFMKLDNSTNSLNSISYLVKGNFIASKYFNDIFTVYKYL